MNSGTRLAVRNNHDLTTSTIDEMDPEDHPTAPLLQPSPEELADVPIFPLIHRIKHDAIKNIDASLTWDQLNAPDVNFSVIRPLLTRYNRLQNRGIIFAFMVVRSHFLSLASEDIAFSALCTTRASFCELMAIKLLREFANSRNRMELVTVLTTGWNALQGAPDQAIKDIRDSVGEDIDEPMSALEVAITTKSKNFIASALAQEVINEIWSGRILFAAASSRSVMADNYKARPIATYHDPIGAPFLDHYRLRVPKYRTIIEMLNFFLLLGFFCLCLANKDFDYAGPTELIFCVYGLGFVFSEFAASQEHGWDVYSANIWNGFDLSFIVLFIVYLVLRIRGLATQNDRLNDTAFDILSCGACILFPRVAFFFISNHVVVVALRAMIVQFVLFMTLAAVCFSGLLFTLWRLSGPEWTFKKIAWLMTRIWFGSTYLSFDVAESFHPIFGPPLMILYAALSNTLLITILISILSSTYAKIDQGATNEYLFQFAISTLEGVKSDAMFSYQPPFNIGAYLILLPASFVLSPRVFHTVNVFLIRLTSFPILVAIAVYERYFAPGSKVLERGKGAAQAIYDSLPRQIKNVAVFEAIVGSSSGDVLDAIFDVDGPDYMLNDGESAIDVARSEAARSIDERPRTPNPPGGTDPRGRLAMPTSPGFRSQRSTSRNPNELQFRIHRPGLSDDVPASPLAKLFGTGARVSQYFNVPPPDLGGLQEDTAATMKRLENMLDGAGGMQKLRADMKEMRERSERMETLLLSLSKGART